jgi:cellulose synthase/poly-beta-1,6-N-acetylglucosamine synthase-like glycosyltransferase
MTAVLLLIGGLGLLLAVFPLTFYPLSLAFARKRVFQNSVPLDPRPSVAICMSAYMEEDGIEAKVEGLLEMARVYGPARIYIYVDGSTDRTATILDRYRDRVHLVVSAARTGKTAGLNVLVEASREDLLAFTDANVLAPPDALVNLLRKFSDPDVAAASARLVYVNPDETGTSGSGAAYWSIEEQVKRLESETIGLVGVDGALFMIRRSAYVHAPPELIDDLFVSLMVMINGGIVVSETDVVVEERNASIWREEFKRKRRIACQSINVHRALWPKLRRLPAIRLYGYLSHRVLKWAIPFNLALGGLGFWGALAHEAGWVLALEVAFGAVACVTALGLVGFRPSRVLWGSFISLAGVAIGVLESVVLRRTYTTWTPAVSVRS